MQYYNEININNIKIEPLTEQNDYLVEGFSCGEIDFDKFIYYDALGNECKIYLILYKNIMLGFFGITATGIITNKMENDNIKEIYNEPAIEINYFATDEKYHGMYIDEQHSEQETLSDIIFIKVLSFIAEIQNIIGFKYIILYSVKPAVNFYKKHNFEEFNKYMVRNVKQYINDCIPLFIRI